MSVSVIHLEECLAMLDVYGENGWRTFAAPTPLVSMLLRGSGRNLAFLAWTRGILFQATDGYAFVIPCADLDEHTTCLQVVRLNLTARGCKDPGCEMFTMLCDARDVCIEDLQPQALFMLKDNLDEERKNQPKEWWQDKESVFVWQETGYVQRELATKAATLITLDGYAMCPVVTNCSSSKLVPLAN